MPSEKDLDKALHEALETNTQFREWFLANLTRATGYYRLVLCRSDHPWCKVRLILPNSETGALEGISRDGETDVLAVFENAAGKKIGVHIENKIASGSFTPYQPEVYAARAEHWIGVDKYGGYEDWETVLVAPKSFVERNTDEAMKFTSRITHEQIAVYIQLFDEGTIAGSGESTPAGN